MTPELWLALKNLSMPGRVALMDWLVRERVIRTYDPRCLWDGSIERHVRMWR